MNKQLLSELEIYIEKNLNNCLVIKEPEEWTYIMPMRSAFKIDSRPKDKALPDETRLEDRLWLEQFRKGAQLKTKEGEDDSCSEGLISEEEELEDYINKERNEETFSSRLLYYIDRSELSDAKIYKRAGIDRRHFSKIRCDRYYQPKKPTAIALCLALELNLEETMELLGMAGYSLSSSDTGDLVVKFCIERGIYDLIEVNTALNYFGQKLLGGVS